MWVMGKLRQNPLPAELSQEMKLATVDEKSGDFALLFCAICFGRRFSIHWEFLRPKSSPTEELYKGAIQFKSCYETERWWQRGKWSTIVSQENPFPPTFWHSPFEWIVPQVIKEERGVPEWYLGRSLTHTVRVSTLNFQANFGQERDKASWLPVVRKTSLFHCWSSCLHS